MQNLNATINTMWTITNDERHRKKKSLLNHLIKTSYPPVFRKEFIILILMGIIIPMIAASTVIIYERKAKSGVKAINPLTALVKEPQITTINVCSESI